MRGDFSCKCGLVLKNVRLPVHHRCPTGPAPTTNEHRLCIHRGKKSGSFECVQCGENKQVDLFECDVHGTCRLGIIDDKRAPQSKHCHTCRKHQQGFEIIPCEHLTKDLTCSIASKISGLPATTTTVACKQCLGCSKPKEINQITVSLAVGSAKQSGDDERVSAIIQSHKDELRHPGFGIKDIESFATRTIAWGLQGAPTRTNQERLAIINTCQSCDFYQPQTESEGFCRHCKCPIGIDSPKVARSTEHCPDSKW